MIATIILGLFAVLFAYSAQHNKTRWGLKASFILIFVFLAIRYKFGNDYITYLNNFNYLKQFDQIKFNDGITGYEPGWLVVIWLFRNIGFFVLIPTLALFNCVVYYRFFKKYVPAQYYWLAVFVYIFYPEFMLIQLSAIRQSIAILFFITTLNFFPKKNAIHFFFIIGLAFLFHTSAIILIPIYLLGLVKQKIYRIVGVAFFLIYASVVLFHAVFSPYVLQVVETYFERYVSYQTAGGVNTGLGYIYSVVMGLLTIYYMRFQNKETAFIFLVSAISFIILPLTMIVGLIARLGFYFLPAGIIAYCNIPMYIKNPVKRVGFLMLIVTATTYRFIQFFNSEIYRYAYETYQSIFSVIHWQ